MTAACQQQHHFAGQGRPDQGVGHADVFGNLDARHGRDLALGQQIAMAAANQLLLRLEGRARQLNVKLAVGHGALHLGSWQVGPQYRHTGAHGRHHGGPVSGPGPALVVPFQRVFGLRFGSAGLECGGADADIRHFQHHCCQQAARRQKGNHLLMRLLVFCRIVLLTQ